MAGELGFEPEILGVRVRASALIPHRFFSKWVLSGALAINTLRLNFKMAQGRSCQEEGGRHDPKTEARADGNRHGRIG